MPVITVVNKTAGDLPINDVIGISRNGASIVKELSDFDLQRSKTTLVALTTAGFISWTVTANSVAGDDAAEGIEKEQLEDGSLTPKFASGVGVGATAKIYAGSGTPEGAVVAAVGSLFMRTNGGASTSLYVKETGSGNTGWVAK